MSLKNSLGMVGQKLVDYGVYNSPTQMAMQAMGQYGGANMGPMGPAQIPAQGQLDSSGARAGGGYGAATRGPATYSNVGKFNRNPDRNGRQGLLESLIQKYSKVSQR